MNLILRISNMWKLPSMNVDADTSVSGLTDRTQSSQATGLSWYDEYAKVANEPLLTDLLVEYLGGDNGQELIVHYMLWLAKSKLPTKFCKKDCKDSPTLFLSPASKKSILKTLFLMWCQHMEHTPMCMV